MKKLLKGTIVLWFLVIALGSTAVYAACGDSVCGMFAGEFVCVAEGPGQVLLICTQSDPCDIRCG